MSTPVHRDEARRTVYGVITLVVFLAIGAVGAVAQTSGPLPGKSYTYVSADFEDIGIMRPGKPVRIDGLGSGIVSDVALEDGLARVTMRLNGDRVIYRDATVSIGNVSALGKRFIALDPGSPDSGVLAEDAVLGIDQTSDDQSLETLLKALDPRTRESLQVSLRALSTGLAGHGDDLNQALEASPDLLSDLKTVSAALTDDQADLPGLLASADLLVSRFAGREEQISDLLANADDTMAALAVDDGRPLSGAISALPDTMVRTRRALDSLQQPLVDARVAVQQLRPGAQALGRSTAALRSVLSDGRSPLDKVPGVSELARPAVVDLTDAIADARPLVRPLASTIANLDTLLFPFAPYADDTGQFFAQHDLLSGTLNGTDDKHYFAALLTGPGLFSVGGLPDPLYTQEAYPIPGTSRNSGVTDSRIGGR